MIFQNFKTKKLTRFIAYLLLISLMISIVGVISIKPSQAATMDNCYSMSFGRAVSCGGARHWGLDAHTIDGIRCLCLDPGKGALYGNNFYQNDSLWWQYSEYQRQVMVSALYLLSQTYSNADHIGYQLAAWYASDPGGAIALAGAANDAFTYPAQVALNLAETHDWGGTSYGNFSFANSGVLTLNYTGDSTYPYEGFISETSGNLYNASNTDYTASGYAGINISLENGGVRVRATQDAVNSYGLTNSNNSYRINVSGNSYRQLTPPYLNSVHVYTTNNGSKQRLAVYDSNNYNNSMATTNYSGQIRLVANATPGTLIINKSSSSPNVTAGNSDYSLQGAVYKLYSSRSDAGSQINAKYTLTTNSSGSASLNNITAGTYYVREYSAPRNYNLNSEINTVTISPNATSTLNVTDTPVHIPLASFNLQKSSGNYNVTSGNSYYNLQGSVYKLYGSQSDARTDSNAKYVLTTDVNGKASVKDIPLGTYYLKEVTAPRGYTVDNTIYSIAMNSETIYTKSVVETPKVGSLTIQKTSSNPTLTNNDSSYSLENAVYKVYMSLSNANSDTNAKYTLTTNSNGYASLSNVPLGTYYIKETDAPAGYEIDTTVYTKTISESALNVSLNINEVPQSGKLQIQKVTSDPEISNGSDCYSLEGAEYTLYSSASNASNGTYPLYSVTTDANGIGNLTGIKPGTYYIKETIAPPGYKLLPIVSQVVIRLNEVTTFTTQDKPKADPVNIALHKIDENSGTTVPAGDMSLADAEFTFKFYGGLYVTASEAEASGNLLKTNVYKTDANGNINLANTNLKVSGDDFWINAEGDITFPLGTIVIQETKAPVGYKLNNEKFVVQISDDGTGDHISHAYNAPIIREAADTGKVTIIKRDSISNVAQGDGTLSNTVFSIINDDDVTINVGNGNVAPGDEVTTITSNNAGTAIAYNLPYGKYVIREKTAPTGYILNSAIEKSFTIDANNKVINLGIVTDDIIQGRITVQKIDAETNLTTPQGDGTFAGCVFNVINASAKPVKLNGQTFPTNAVVESITTNASGLATSSVLPYGTYRIQEARSSNGYALNTDYSSTVQIRTNNETVAADNCPNTYLENSISIQASKLMNGIPANASDGFTFELVENNTVLQTKTVQDGGLVIFDPIEYTSVGTHTYTIREKIKDSQKVTYDPHEETVTVTVTQGTNKLIARVSYDTDGAVFSNETIPGQLRIIKNVENASPESSNSQFRFKVKITDADGNPITDAYVNKQSSHN